MNDEKSTPLYEDERFKIDYHPTSVEDHVLYIKVEGGEERGYTLARGILEDLARAPRNDIERKIGAFDDRILFHLREQEIRIDVLYIALCRAFIEEEDRIREFIRTQ